MEFRAVVQFDELLEIEDGQRSMLVSLFQLGRRSIDLLVKKRCTAQGLLAFGRIRIPGDDAHEVVELDKAIEEEHPLRLESPFEGCASIAGGLWSGKSILGLETEDALARLRFEAGTVDLPIHVHEHSDRFIFVESGSGFFHFSDGALATFDGRRVVSLPVGQGDMILFTRDVLHTFSAPDQSLNLLSYHSPEIGFDDPRQFTLPRVLWRPNDKGNAKNVAQP